MSDYQSEYTKGFYPKAGKFEWLTAEIPCKVSQAIEYLLSIKDEAEAHNNGYANFQIKASKDKKDENGKPKLFMTRNFKTPGGEVTSKELMPDRAEANTDLPF